MSRQIGMNSLGEFQYDSLLAGDFPRADEAVTLKAGRVYPVGSVLGRITDSGLCVLVDSSQSDGSENVFGILSEKVDATSEDCSSVAYLTGEFVEQRLTFGGSDDVETHRDAARARSIFFKKAALQPNQ